MSGIAGIYRFDGGSVEADTVAAMTEAIDHQGPDGEWTWREGRVGLGHQRFETTPEAEHAGSPPERGSRVLTFDGRIDNREELLRELDVDGPAGTVADADLVLAAYERWGEDCPERLIGAFAFAIRDPDEERLFAARDHVGLRPFYYYRGENRFLFGSEIKTLWAAGGVPQRLDEIRLSNYLTRQLQSHERTFFEEVKRLPPAHVLVADDDGVETTEYWALDPDRTIDLETDEAYAERFRELFFEAVECRLRAKGPIGSTLSGGLDSSSIVSTADELREDEDDFRLYTYSAVFDEEELSSSDEREYINAVLEKCSATPRYFRGDQRDPLSDLETILYHSETPSLGNNFYLNWNIYRGSCKDDVHILLDGFGGDQVSSHGIGYLPELAAGGRWLTLAGEIRAFNERFDQGSKLRNLIFNQTLVPLLPSWARKAVMKMRHDEFRDVVNSALDPEFLERTDAKERLFDSVATRPATARKLHHTRLRPDLVVLVLERLNKTSKAFNIEPRYPFFDRRLVEFCLALPADQKIQQGWLRYAMRNAMEGVLPPEVQQRPDKATLAPSFWQALQEYTADDIAKILFEDDPQIAEYIDLERARSGYRELADEGSSDLNTVWYPIVLEVWLRSGVGPSSQ